MVIKSGSGLEPFTQFTMVVGRLMPNGLKPLGTAFLVNHAGVFVTARHVVGNDSTGLVIVTPNIQHANEYQNVSDHHFNYANAVVIESDPIKDIVLLKIDGSAMGVPPIGGLDDAVIGDDVEIFGFPHVTEGRRAFTYQRSEVGAKILLDSSGVKSKHAVLNIQSRPGQSGSPVFCPRVGKVVAMLIGTYALESGVSFGGINPRELNQTTHIVSTEYITEML